MKPVSPWLALFLLAVIAGFATVMTVQRVQLYVLQKDIERLELLLEEDNCWYEENHYITTSKAGYSGPLL